MRDLSDPLSSKRLYISDLAEQLEAMESARRPMNPVAYRLFARRLKSALAGCPAPLLAQLADAHPCIAQALEQRHFDDHGLLLDAGAAQVRGAALTVLGRLTRRAH